MRNIGRYTLVLAAGSLLAACSSLDKNRAVSPTEVEDKTWVLSSLNSEPPVDGRRITLEFQSFSDKEGKVSGNGPCNGYFGSYTVQQDELQFARTSSTMMACPEPVMEQEMAFFSELQKADTMMSNGKMLVLKERQSKDELRFVAEIADVKGVVKSATGHFPANSDILIQLRDVSKKDTHSNLIGEKKIKLKYELDGPLEFEVPYSPTLIQPDHTYSVSAEVRHRGKLISHSVSSNIVDLSRSLGLKVGRW